MNRRSIGAVVAGVLVIVGVTTLVDIVLHAAGVFPPMDQPIDDSLALLATAYRTVISVGGAFCLGIVDTPSSSIGPAFFSAIVRSSYLIFPSKSQLPA